MLKHSIKLKGIIDTEIKQKDNKYYFTLNTSINKDDSNKTLIYVELTKNMFEAIKDFYKDNVVTISGTVQAKKTKNDVPFIYLKSSNIYLQRNNDKDISVAPKELPEKESNQKQKFKKASNPWYSHFSDDEFIQVDTSKIYLVEEEHFKANVYFDASFFDENKPIGVRKIEDDKFALVIGFREYMFAKLLNKPTIKACITELNSKDFKDTYINKKKNIKFNSNNTNDN